MRRILIALALSALVVAPISAQEKAATAGEKAAAFAAVQRFVDSFNRGDVAAAAAACTEEASIIDEFPPHEWHGAGACSKWMADYDADAKRNGITDGLVTLGKPLHVDVDGDHAYVVVPVKYAFKQKGKAMSEDHSFLTVALRKDAAGWRTLGWSWTKG